MGHSSPLAVRLRDHTARPCRLRSHNESGALTEDRAADLGQLVLDVLFDLAVALGGGLDAERAQQL